MLFIFKFGEICARTQAYFVFFGRAEGSKARFLCILHIPTMCAWMIKCIKLNKNIDFISETTWIFSTMNESSAKDFSPLVSTQVLESSALMDYQWIQIKHAYSMCLPTLPSCSLQFLLSRPVWTLGQPTRTRPVSRCWSKGTLDTRSHTARHGRASL